ncbi:MAG: hypothetical protein NXI04_22060 [Planctomycetaceae bacterium]|nr:hypothetical protein [Planctomycetaceae bacterium]
MTLATTPTADLHRELDKAEAAFLKAKPADKQRARNRVANVMAEIQARHQACHAGRIYDQGRRRWVTATA